MVPVLWRKSLIVSQNIKQSSHVAQHFFVADSKGLKTCSQENSDMSVHRSVTNSESAGSGRHSQARHLRGRRPGLILQEPAGTAVCAGAVSSLGSIPPGPRRPCVVGCGA